MSGIPLDTFLKNQEEVCADVVVELWFVAHLQRTFSIFTQHIWIHFETKNKFMVMEWLLHCSPKKSQVVWQMWDDIWQFRLITIFIGLLVQICPFLRLRLLSTHRGRVSCVIETLPRCVERSRRRKNGLPKMVFLTHVIWPLSNVPLRSYNFFYTTIGSNLSIFTPDG